MASQWTSPRLHCTVTVGRGVGSGCVVLTVVLLPKTSEPYQNASSSAFFEGLSHFFPFQYVYQKFLLVTCQSVIAGRERGWGTWDSAVNRFDWQRVRIISCKKGVLNVYLFVYFFLIYDFYSFVTIAFLCVYLFLLLLIITTMFCISSFVTSAAKSYNRDIDKLIWSGQITK